MDFFAKNYEQYSIRSLYFLQKVMNISSFFLQKIMNITSFFA